MRYLILVLIGLSSLAVAGETHEMRIEVNVANEDGSFFSLDSDTLDFDMREMQVGENRAYTDEQGRNVLMTRTDAGYTVDVEGKSFELPAFVSEEQQMQLVQQEIAGHALQHEIGRAIEIAQAHGAEIASKEIVVLSSDDIDAATQDAIRVALQAGGYDKPVKFANAAERVLEKQIWVSRSEDLSH